MNVKINILLRTNITSPVAHCAPGQLGDGRPGTQETGGHRGRSLRQGEARQCSAAVANVNEKVVLYNINQIYCACVQTCLLYVFSRDQFPEEYVPTVFETYVAVIELDNQEVRRKLIRTDSITGDHVSCEQQQHMKAMFEDVRNGEYSTQRMLLYLWFCGQVSQFLVVFS